eukprot:COSAG06_NODE_717_length_12831_cov_52.780003_3_plen_397_part_00
MLLGALSLLMLLARGVSSSWAPQPVPISTRWAKDVHPEQVPAYPRPQFQRNVSWLSLNGLWELDYRTPTSLETPPFNRTLPDQILVPYPVESSLSGVRQQPAFGYMWYRRALPELAPGSGGRVLLHFGAVDWRCSVFVAGQLVGNHSGGYTGFSFDITSVYRPGAELLVGVYDPSDCGRQEHKPGQEGLNPCPASLTAAGIAGQQPIGKQMWGAFGNKTGTSAGNSQGIKYTPTSGIWQTVWLERVPASCYLAQAKITTAVEGPDGTGGSITVEPLLTGPGCGEARFEAEVYDRTTGEIILPRTSVQQGGATAAAVVQLQLPRPARHWSPASPYLYGLRLTVGADTVEAYAGAATPFLAPLSPRKTIASQSRAKDRLGTNIRKPMPKRLSFFLRCA